MTFLIAEDDALWQRLLKAVVAGAGHQHRVATNWPKVMSSMRQGGFSGLIADLSLGTDTEAGIEALSFLEKLSPPKTMIVCTHFSNRVINDCYRLPFVRSVVPKSKIAEHLEEIVEFFDHTVDQQTLRRLIDADLKGRSPDGAMNEVVRDSIFVVHGRNADARREMFAFLRALGLKPMEWGEAIQTTGTGAPFVGDVLEKALQRAGAVIVLLTGDDEGRLLKRYWSPGDPSHEKEYTPQARLNVVFEAGLALAAAPTRTIFVQFGTVRQFSDITGRHIVHFRGDVAGRNELATRLESAGCAVRRGGTDWLSAGDFTRVVV